MAGICGWLAPAQHHQIDSRVIEQMTAKLPPGSTGSNMQCAGGWLSGRFQAQNHSAGITAVLDNAPGWTNNRLAAIAAERGHAHALIEAYLAKPNDFLMDLSGSFAFAIQDEKSGKLLLAVDRMGQRPLCYARSTSGTVVFGSTTHSILAHPEVDSRLSSQAIYDYIYFHVVPSPMTIYSDIAKLEPGQLLSCNGQNVRPNNYWNPSFDCESKIDEVSLQEELLESLRQAVTRCQPNGSTGCFLSGGLDSTTVSGLANDIVASPIRAYSIGFEQEGYDEMKYARIAAKHFDMDLREYYVSPDDVADAIQLIATAYDEPFGNSSAIPAFFCAKRAAQEGVTCLLAGDGGDELFGGNERYSKQHIFERYGLLPAWLRTGLIEPALSSLPTDWNVITRKARRYVEQARIPMPERMQTYNYLHLNSPEQIFDPGFLGEVDTHQPIAAMDAWYGRSGNTDLLNKMLHFDWKLTLADNDIRKVNRMCELAGVEVKYPLLDDELIAMSTRIPSRLKMKENQLRYFFKATLKQFLPEQILSKEKHGFGLPFGEWLRTSNRLQEAVFPSIELLKNRSIFDPSFIDDLIHRHKVEHPAYYGNFIWVLTMLEVWLQTHTTSDSDS